MEIHRNADKKYPDLTLELYPPDKKYSIVKFLNDLMGDRDEVTKWK